MRSASHVFVSACAVPWVWSGVQTFAGDALSLAAVAAGVMAGSKAPDWLELKRWAFGRRFSVVPHRTLTHTWWVWIVAFLWVAHLWGAAHPITLWCAGFAGSALLHILCDAATPMGVPMLWPFGKKVSLARRWPWAGHSILLLCAAAALYKVAPFVI